MPTKESDISSGTSEPWNIAKGYVTLKILFPLVEFDKLVKLAKFGCEYTEDSIQTSPEVKSLNRVEALKRILSTLESIFNSSEFAIRKKDKDKFAKYKERLKAVSGVIKGVSSEKTDARIAGGIFMTINEKHFNLCLDSLINILREMNVELNNAELIFPSADEMDLERIKEEIMSGM